MQDLIQHTHEEWHPILRQAIMTMDEAYWQRLSAHTAWLPPKNRLLQAFSQPLSQVRYVLLGESPYPRAQSANGYAFWDAAVRELWQPSGLSKAVNRATSLRNFIKMLLHASGDLRLDFSQSAIAALDKTNYIQTADALFQGMLGKGFLLLNASLVYEQQQVAYHAKQWRPFVSSLLGQLGAWQCRYQQSIHMILLGKVAAHFQETAQFPCLIAEHPYNISFMHNPAVLNFFKPMELLNV